MIVATEYRPSRYNVATSCRSSTIGTFVSQALLATVPVPGHAYCAGRVCGTIGRARA
jgi:hypothetical protein